MSVSSHDRVRVRRQLQLLEMPVAASDLDAEGVVTVQIGATEADDPGGVQLLLESGLSLSGIRVMDNDVEVTGTLLSGMFLVVIGEGSGALLVDEDAGVSTPAERLQTSPSAASVGVDRRQVIIRYDSTASRWIVPNWGAESDAVTTSSYTSTSGVPHVLWSYSLAEDEVIGGRLEITGKFTSGGVTSRSRGFIDFAASRSVGGVAAVTNNNSLENGTLAAGTISIDTNGANLVRVNITYSVNGTVNYTTRLHYDAL